MIKQNEGKVTIQIVDAVLDVLTDDRVKAVIRKVMRENIESVKKECERSQYTLVDLIDRIEELDKDPLFRVRVGSETFRHLKVFAEDAAQSYIERIIK